jgi:hypothetical protein
MYHELSLIVLGILHHDAGGSSSHVRPTLACALAGIFCYTQEFRSDPNLLKNPSPLRGSATASYNLT